MTQPIQPSTSTTNACSSESTSTDKAHPTPTDKRKTQRMDKKPRVLFLCDGREGLSLIAQSVLNHKADTHYTGISGFTGKVFNEDAACGTLRRYNIDCTSTNLKPLEHYADEHVDFVVALTPSAVQSGKPFPAYGKFIPWDITSGGDVTEMAMIIKAINDQVNYFLSVYLYR
ncbi:hypothetical protein [Enterovibrio norvegicus]|uniref:hypothetical protein n=1 Tax=Enterovibrio norvegicus TaxID=188144 RepID=UPI000C82E1B6|nr:hypothetical protein [Enterovibrio norvegicus]PML81013.1 hypothetical protein BCT69_10245 [Enterovibrio norvegicus]